MSVPDESPRVPTFRQYLDRERRRIATKNSTPIARVARRMPESAFFNDWRDHVVRAFNDGATIPTGLWRSLDEPLRYRVLRTHRALSDDDLTSHLIGKNP